jgi:hypothetical protein
MLSSFLSFIRDLAHDIVVHNLRTVNDETSVFGAGRLDGKHFRIRAYRPRSAYGER